MTTIRLSPPDAWPQAGFPFNQAVVESAGRRVHITGQVAWDTEGSIVGVGDPTRQTDVAIDNIERLLAHLGGTIDDIVSLTTYYVRDDDLQAIYSVRKRRFAIEHGPASTGIKVAGLVHPDFLVELTPTAVIPEDRFITPQA